MIRRLFATIFAGCVATIASGCAMQHSDDALVSSVRGLKPSVVLLTMRVPPDTKKDAYDDAYATGTVVASGAWGSDILTVQHAIDRAWNLHVTIANSRKYPAKVIAQNSKLDIALVRVAARSLPVVALGASNALESDVGRTVGLLGYPIPDEFQDENLGLATSINSGRLSALRKDALELTLTIVPGESGGPVFLADTGEIIGIADSRFDDEPSIGFAIPIDDAKRFLHRYDAEHGL